MVGDEQVQEVMGEVGEQLRQTILELPKQEQSEMSAGAEEGGMMTIEGVAEIVKATFVYVMESDVEVDEQGDPLNDGEDE